MSTMTAVAGRRVRHLYVVPSPERGEPAAPVGRRRSLVERLDLDGLRLTARGRVVAVLAGMALAAPLLWGATAAVADVPASAVEVRAHAVAPGETLWGLAAALAEPGQDVREVVRDVQDLNGLTTGTLRVGQTVYLPVG